MLVREGAIGSRTLPVREASRDVELGKETPNEEVGCEPPPENPALERGESGWMRPPNNGGTTPDQGTPAPVHPVKALPAGEEHGALQEEKEEEKEMIRNTASDEEELDEPDVTLAATPPIVGHTIPLRIPMPTEEEIARAAATVTHP